jgi:hypothetical protein
MRTVALLGVLAAAGIVAAACSNPTIIEKTTTVEKDASGLVLKRIERETVTQRIDAKILQLDYIKVEEYPEATSSTPATR